MVRLVDVDYANPQLRDYVCREIERIIPKLRPDGIHADNLSDTNLGHANICAFGLWSLLTFCDTLRATSRPLSWSGWSSATDSHGGRLWAFRGAFCAHSQPDLRVH